MGHPLRKVHPQTDSLLRNTIEIRPCRFIGVYHSEIERPPPDPSFGSDVGFCGEDSTRKPDVSACQNLPESSTAIRYSDYALREVDPPSGLPAGSSSDVVVFFLHGVGGSIDVWSSQIAYLAERRDCRVVAFDSLGHGRSSAPAADADAYSFAELATDAMMLFHLYRGSRNIVVGHSYGCRFATLLAHHYAELVSKLVLVSGGSPLPLYPHPHLLCLPDCVLRCLRTPMCKYLRRKMFHRRDADLLERCAVPPTHVLKHTMLGQLWPDGDVDFHAEIGVETLLVHGRLDSLVPVSDTEMMHETLRNSRLKIVDGAGHMVMMEKPDEVNACIREFIFDDADVDSNTKQFEMDAISLR